ncbi:MAG TPA: Uma2 family endonuclease [Pseudonocardiaceae bacterium]|nr:Uma2 family endonuclease [Pseudonocardiaceae bacterium]
MDHEDHPAPRWVVPPPEGWQADDLDRLPPNAPRRVELIDGALVVMAPQTAFHMRVINALLRQLAEQAPPGLEIAREMTIRLDERQRPEPDLLVVDGPALDDGTRTWLVPNEVHLVIEVLSPESEVRDTQRKPQLYAQAGIKHFWRVENDGGRAVVFTYELDPATRSYVSTNICRETLAISEPFPIKLQVDKLHERRLKLS